MFDVFCSCVENGGNFIVGYDDDGDEKDDVWMMIFSGMITKGMSVAWGDDLS
jgi:hypothetical protein